MANYQLMYSPEQFTLFNADGSAPTGIKQQEFYFTESLNSLFSQLNSGDTITYGVESA
jgi:hypothetical protein